MRIYNGIILCLPGKRPSIGVIETDRKSAKMKPLHPIQKWLRYGSLIERKYEGYNPDVTRDIEYFNGRKLFNSNLADIIKALRGLKSNQYVLERSLTPREALRIMGVSENGITKLCRSKIPSNELRKMNGNSIVVLVLEKIFENLFIPKELQTLIFNTDEAA